jgi:hypothetical protein
LQWFLTLLIEKKTKVAVDHWKREKKLVIGAIECYENGKLTKQDATVATWTNGNTIKWSQPGLYLRMEYIHMFFPFLTSLPFQASKINPN